jgi:hypothetical protein
MQLSHLRIVVESIYPTSKPQQSQQQSQPQLTQQPSQLFSTTGQEVADSIFYAAAYVNRITVNKANLLLHVDASANIDTSTGTLTGGMLNSTLIAFIHSFIHLSPSFSRHRHRSQLQRPADYHNSP